ncbi:MAG: pyruvoyl-dependent arginine decarboxylase [Haloarculaceae archaeon]
MNAIRVLRGGATGPTALSSYDAALASVNLHDYNLVHVSSVVPPGTRVEPVDTAPDLGPPGDRLTVVEACRTLAPGEDGPACAAIGWALPRDGAGVLYEGSGTDPEGVRREVTEGLRAARELRGDRDWTGGETGLELATADARSERYVTAVALAVFGDGEPVG